MKKEKREEREKNRKKNEGKKGKNERKEKGKGKGTKESMNYFIYFSTRSKEWLKQMVEKSEMLEIVLLEGWPSSVLEKFFSKNPKFLS